MRQVTIYPHFNALYYCYFVQGVGNAYGWDRVSFSREGFPDFGHDCLAFRVSGPEGERKVYIHAHDSTSLNPEGLEWCDTFGKVNLDPTLVPPKDQHRVKATGPIFPVRLWGMGRTAWIAVRNLIAANKRLLSYRLTDADPLEKPVDRSLLDCYELHLVNYAKIFLHKRLPLAEYHPGPSQDWYMFFSSGLWPEQHYIKEYAEAHKQANQNRVNFIRACKSMPDITFEGGFWERKRVQVDNYEDLTAKVDYDHHVYIKKTQSSMAVFNTPALKRCHSWKLAEFLALGKAIISIPPVREMPEPLVHGQNVHYVDGSMESISDAIRKICGDHDYRRHLEVNARAYYDKWIEPTAVIRRLVG